MSDLVGNPEDRFSHNGTHMYDFIDFTGSKRHKDFLKINRFPLILVEHRMGLTGNTSYGANGRKMW